MTETVAEELTTHPPIPNQYNRWLPDEELDVFVKEFQRTGFQGGLNWYRVAIDQKLLMELLMYSGRTLDVPTMFVSGVRDWGSYQEPGALEKMEKVCSKWKGKHFIDGAGHVSSHFLFCCYLLYLLLSFSATLTRRVCLSVRKDTDMRIVGTTRTA